MIWQTSAERRLTGFAKEMFGEHLGSLLLAGYGDDQKLQGRRFVIALKDEEGKNSDFYLKATTDAKDCFFPRRKEPLVMLALLQMLCGGKGSEVVYRYENILSHLGWSNDAESQVAVDQAVVGYYHLSYQPVERLEELTGKAPTARINRYRLVTGYMLDEAAEDPQEALKRSMNQVAFNPELLMQLKQGSLFGIAWKNVRSLVLVP